MDKKRRCSVTLRMLMIKFCKVRKIRSMEIFNSLSDFVDWAEEYTRNETLS